MRIRVSDVLGLLAVEAPESEVIEDDSYVQRDETFRRIAPSASFG